MIFIIFGLIFCDWDRFFHMFWGFWPFLVILDRFFLPFWVKRDVNIDQNITKFRGVWPILTTWDRFGPFYGRFGSYMLDILIYIIEKVSSPWFQCILIPEIYFLNQIVTSFDHIMHRQFQISVLDYFRPFLGRLESLVMWNSVDILEM